MIDNKCLSKLLKLYGVSPRDYESEILQSILPEMMHSRTEVFFRRYLSYYLDKLPENIYTKITKYLKTKIQSDDDSAVQKQHEFEKIIEENRTPEDGLWSSPPLPFVLTHDIDTKACYKAIKNVAEIENKYHLNSTWHFLTNGPYKIDYSMLDEMKNSGHEIGLHGVWHDLAFGYRNKKNQMKELGRGTKAIEKYKPISYRSPGLAWTPVLSGSLMECAFRANSSLRTYSNGWNVFRPVTTSDGLLWEIPLTLQDDYLFKSNNFTEKEATLYIEKTLYDAVARKAPVTFNFHPSIINNKLRWYEDILRKIIEDGKWKIVTVSDIVIELDQAWKNCA